MRTGQREIGFIKEWTKSDGWGCCGCGTGAGEPSDRVAGTKYLSTSAVAGSMHSACAGDRRHAYARRTTHAPGRRARKMARVADKPGTQNRQRRLFETSLAHLHRHCTPTLVDALSSYPSRASQFLRCCSGLRGMSRLASESCPMQFALMRGDTWTRQVRALSRVQCRPPLRHVAENALTYLSDN